MKKIQAIGMTVLCIAIITFFSINLVHAQIFEGIDITPEGELITKADLHYTATSTISNLLTEEELIKIKEEYNNNQEIIIRLDRIIKTLDKINQK